MPEYGKNIEYDAEQIGNIAFDSNDPGRRSTRFRHTCVEYREGAKDSGKFAIFINISLDSFATYRKKVKIMVVELLDDW